MAFHNPYHFVPAKKEERTNELNKVKFESGDLTTHSHVTHDSYVESRFSGRIICRLTTETPTFVGARQTRNGTATEPGEYEPYQLNNKPAIPASTLRGLISSIVEAASNSSLRVLENQKYSFRKQAAPGDALTSIGMIIKENDENYELLPLKAYKVKLNSDTYQTFHKDDQVFYYLPIEVDETEQDLEGSINAPIERAISTAAEAGYKRGILRKMKFPQGVAENRKYDLFILFPNQAEQCFNFQSASGWTTLDILPEAIERFHFLADQRTEESKDEEIILPFHPVGTVRNEEIQKNEFRLKHGDLVYFRKQGNMVTEISLSSIWRDWVAKDSQRKQSADTFDFFSAIDAELLPFNKSRQVITLAERIFGFVENNKEFGGADEDKTESSLAGRIYPSPAYSVGIRHEDGTLDTTTTYFGEGVILKALSNPKPPSPALYFKQVRQQGNNFIDDPKYIAKKNLNPRDHHPQGRKFYLHRRPNDENGTPWKTNHENDLLKMKTQITPIKENVVFHFHFDFDNLSENELGALLYALRPTEEFRHKLGMGKSIGLGRVRITPVGVFLVDRKSRYSTSGMFASRYSEVWKHSEAKQDEWFESYWREKEAYVTEMVKSPDALRDNFRQRMNEDIRFALEVIGRFNVVNGKPDTLSKPVHPPTVHSQRTDKEKEEETYRWFVENDVVSKDKDDKDREFLEPLNMSLKKGNQQAPLPNMKEL